MSETDKSQEGGKDQGTEEGAGEGRRTRSQSKRDAAAAAAAAQEGGKDMNTSKAAGGDGGGVSPGGEGGMGGEGEEPTVRAALVSLAHQLTRLVERFDRRDEQQDQHLQEMQEEGKKTREMIKEQGEETKERLGKTEARGEEREKFAKKNRDLLLDLQKKSAQHTRSDEGVVRKQLEGLQKEVEELRGKTEETARDLRQEKRAADASARHTAQGSGNCEGGRGGSPASDGMVGEATATQVRARRRSDNTASDARGRDRGEVRASSVAARVCERRRRQVTGTRGASAPRRRKGHATRKRCFDPGGAGSQCE